MHAGDIKFTVTITLDSNGTYELAGKDSTGQGLRLAQVRDALQWGVNRANDEMVAGMVNATIKTILGQQLTQPK